MSVKISHVANQQLLDIRGENAINERGLII